MKKIEVYRCLNCEAQSRKQSITCNMCGKTLLNKQDVKLFYKTDCCNAIIGKNELFCPYCGGVENGK